MKVLFVFIALIVGPLFTSNAQWSQIKNASITFKIKNAGIGVNGSFEKSSLQVYVDDSNPNLSHFSGTVESQSIQTGIKLRDNHLRDKEEFFNVKKFPSIVMKSVGVQLKSKGIYTVKWALTIKGITRQFSTDVLSLLDGNLLKLSTSFTINRNEWGVGGNSLTMGDNVTIKLSTTLTK